MTRVSGCFGERDGHRVRRVIPFCLGVKHGGGISMKNILAVSFVLFAVSAAQAQVSTGSLGGLVTDPNNAIVPGASISVKNEATGVELKTTSSDAGLYVFPTLNTGTYVVSVEKAGFKRGT